MSTKDPLFFYHDLLNLSHDTSMASIGFVSADDLRLLRTIKTEFNTVGWPPVIEEKDVEIAKKYAFNNEACIEQDDFVKFCSISEDDDKETFKKVISNYFDLKDHVEEPYFDLVGFSAYFAHLHDDSGNAEWRAQVNFILDNEAEHRILSIDSKGNHHIITPKSGEIIFLEVSCKHAIIPNQKLGYETMRNKPMVSLFVS